MPISVTCTACLYETKVPDSAAGMKGKCPKCGSIVRVPKPETPIDADVVEAEVIETPPSSSLDDPISLAGLADGTPVAKPVQDRRPCPACGEMIALGAMKCRFCNEIFDPALKRREAKKSKPSFVGGDGDDLTGGEWVLAILCSGIGCIMGLIWMLSGKPKGKKMFLVSAVAAIFWMIVRTALEAAAQSGRR